MRRHDLDNVRWATVILVAVYHVFYLFNACGVPAGVGPYAPVQPQDALLPLVYPWFMVLLFAVAGIVARYTLTAGSVKHFIVSRTVKLLVPATLGLLALHWVTGWLNVTIGGGMTSMREVPLLLRYLIFALSGTGPLWFSQTLWLFSLPLALLHRLDRKGKLYALCGRVSPVALFLLMPLLWAGAQVGNMPLLTMYRFGIYAVAFFGGYLFLSQEKARGLMKKLRFAALSLALVTGAAYAALHFGADYTADAVLRSFFTNLYAWLATVAILGCAESWWSKTSPFAAYMTRASYGVYVLHYLFALLSCWLLKSYTPLPPWASYPIAILFTLAASFGAWELLRRIPWVRFLVLGIKRPQTKKTTA